MLILDWFDGPVEAIAEGSDGESYLVLLQSDLPIGSDPVYELRRLSRDAYQEARAAAEALYGPGTGGPSWVIVSHPDTDPEAVARLEAVLDRAGRAVDQRVGRFIGRTDEALVVDWRG